MIWFYTLATTFKWGRCLAERFGSRLAGLRTSWIHLWVIENQMRNGSKLSPEHLAFPFHLNSNCRNGNCKMSSSSCPSTFSFPPAYYSFILLSYHITFFSFSELNWYYGLLLSRRINLMWNKPWYPCLMHQNLIKLLWQLRISVFLKVCAIYPSACLFVNL